MFKKKIKYTDFNGTERNEDFYFHLSTPEVTRLEAEMGGVPIDVYTKNLSEQSDLTKMLDFMEKIILNSYGKKTSDGKSFRKNKDIREEFEYSQAYAEFFEELLTNPDLARKFGEAVADNGKPKKNQVSPKVVQD